MSDAISNSDAELRRRAERRVDVLGQIADLQGELREFKAEDKADGFTEQALGQVIKELRSDAEYRARRLTLEAEIDTYRRAVGLPTTLEAAHAAVQAEAVSVPDTKGALQ